MLAACPFCHTTYTAPPELAGRGLHCKQCGQFFRLPPGPPPEPEHVDEARRDRASIVALLIFLVFVLLLTVFWPAWPGMFKDFVKGLFRGA